MLLCLDFEKKEEEKRREELKNGQRVRKERQTRLFRLIEINGAQMNAVELCARIPTGLK